MEISSNDALQILKGIDLAAYQLQQLAKEVGSHDQQFIELKTQLNEIKTNLALLTASKTRSDLSIAALPDYMSKVDSLHENAKRMQSNMDSIRNQAWGGFLCAVILSISTLVIGQKPVKSEPEVRYDQVHQFYAARD